MIVTATSFDLLRVSLNALCCFVAPNNPQTARTGGYTPGVMQSSARGAGNAVHIAGVRTVDAEIVQIPPSSSLPQVFNSMFKSSTFSAFKHFFLNSLLRSFSRSLLLLEVVLLSLFPFRFVSVCQYRVSRDTEEVGREMLTKTNMKTMIEIYVKKHAVHLL